MYAGRGSDFAKALAISREVTPLLQMRQGIAAIIVDSDEMIPTPLKPIPCNRQVLDAILGAIEQHRCAVATLRARKLQQRRLAWRLWGIQYVETISIDAPEEPEWAIMTADIEAAEQEKRELNAVVERVPALLTYFTHLVDAGITPIVCGRDRQKLRGWKTHAGRPQCGRRLGRALNSNLLSKFKLILE